MISLQIKYYIPSSNPLSLFSSNEMFSMDFTWPPRCYITFHITLRLWKLQIFLRSITRKNFRPLHWCRSKA